MADPTTAVLRILETNWSSSNTGGITPKFARVTDYKRIDFNTAQDWIVIQRTRPEQSPAGVGNLAKNRFDTVDLVVYSFGQHQEDHFHDVLRELDRVLDGMITFGSEKNKEYDLSGNLNTGTWTGTNVNGGGAQYTSSGYWRYGGTFNGSDTKITVSDDASIQNIWGGGATCIFAVKPDAVGTLMSKGLPWTVSLGDLSGGVCALNFVVRCTTGSRAWVTTSRVITIGSWNFVSITLDSDSSDNDPVIRVNNVVADLTQYSDTGGTVLDDTGIDLLIGNYTTSFHDGDLDMVMLFTEIISDARITALYNKSAVDLTGCVLYYSFDHPLLVDGPYITLNPDFQRLDLSDKVSHVYKMLVPVQLGIYAKSRT